MITLVNKHNKSVGVTLLRWKGWLVELWRCPVGEVVQPHTHPDQDSTLMFLSGCATLGKKEPGCGAIERLVVGGLRSHAYYISASTVHWFHSVTKVLWFINISHRNDTTQLASASVNFQSCKL